VAAAVLSSVVRKGLTDKAIFKKSLKGDEEMRFR
jgi:hypothetical protein